jgi:hypothetical protein
MKRDLPIFDIVLKDDDLKQGVGMISLVDDPAIGVNWIKLRRESLVDIEMSFTLTEKGICLGCPPTGDGTRKDGSPDKRCGDGVRKTSSKKPKEPKKEEPKKEEPKKEAKEKLKDRSFEEPVTAKDLKDTGMYNDMSEREKIRYANQLYNIEVEKQIKKEYGSNIQWGMDDTWDSSKGEPYPQPKGKVRGTKSERRSADDIAEGYPMYKITIDWIDK